MATNFNNYTDPTPIGFADTVNAGRIGSGAFAVEIDFSKLGGVETDDLVFTGLLPGGMKIRQSAVVVTEPLAVVDNADEADTLNSATLIPYARTAGVADATLGTGAIAANERGETSFPTGVAVVVSPLAETFLIVKVGINHGTTPATDGKLISGKVLVIIYADYSPSLDEVVSLYPAGDETYAKVGA